jgi:hypothetical protein
MVTIVTRFRGVGARAAADAASRRGAAAPATSKTSGAAQNLIRRETLTERLSGGVTVRLSGRLQVGAYALLPTLETETEREEEDADGGREQLLERYPHDQQRDSNQDEQ